MGNLLNRGRMIGWVLADVMTKTALGQEKSVSRSSFIRYKGAEDSANYIRVSHAPS